MVLERLFNLHAKELFRMIKVLLMQRFVLYIQYVQSINILLPKKSTTIWDLLGKTMPESK